MKFTQQQLMVKVLLVVGVSLVLGTEKGIEVGACQSLLLQKGIYLALGLGIAYSRVEFR